MRCICIMGILYVTTYGSVRYIKKKALLIPKATRLYDTSLASSFSVHSLTITIAVWHRTSATFVQTPVSTDRADHTRWIRRRRCTSCQISWYVRRQGRYILENHISSHVRVKAWQNRTDSSIKVAKFLR